MTDSSSSAPTLNLVRVLVLDDDEIICQFLQRSLERRGYVVVSETSPQDALQRIADENFDVVVSDLNMEGLDGIAFTERVLALRKDLPVIMITGSATIDTAMKAVHAGAWDFLPKPIDPKLLILSMNRACQNRALKRELLELRSIMNESDAPVRAEPENEAATTPAAY